MRSFAQVDVFTTEPGLGNPVAVVLDGSGLSTEAMQRFAAWTNLSETTFVLPPSGEADYRVRIFTPTSELPFAGHPTIGTCWAVLDAGLVKPTDGAVTQECAAGLVPLTVTDGVVTFTAPVAEIRPEPGGLDELAEALSGVRPHAPTLVNAGPPWLTARVTPAELDSLTIDSGLLLRLFAEHGWDLTLYAVDADDVVHVRSFFPTDALVEDPVCGSGNVAVAAHRRATAGFTGAYASRQGSHRGRDGHLAVSVDADAIRVGGRAVTVVRGTVAI
ncbi:PhzF family phenazine biosynthesis protein [Spongisporangium articulatum]|uniref:PhzF family phenazine biosynthesis protein n=1 Tax=Spongisporangium articulatum TaxID=3362603 RepID=A0ABW8AS77_9ACTN